MCESRLCRPGSRSYLLLERGGMGVIHRDDGISSVRREGSAMVGDSRGLRGVGWGGLMVGWEDKL